MTPWPNLIKKLPKGLSARQAARRLRRNYNTTRYWLLKRGYHRKDGRRVPWSSARWRDTAVVDPKRVDWTLTDSEIGRRVGVSRQRIGQLRRIHANGHERRA